MPRTVRVVRCPEFDGEDQPGHEFQTLTEWLDEAVGDEVFHSLTPLTRPFFALATEPANE